MVGLADTIRSEADAYAYLETLRWNGTPECPHCHATRVYFLTPANGTARKTRTGTMSERRVWKCSACRRQFSALTGTIMHGTKIPVRAWVLVIFEMCANKNGIAAREVERRYGVCARSAWFMLHRIREAMTRDPVVGRMRGVVVADETFIGGKPKNRHANRRPPIVGINDVSPDKIAVLSLIEAATGEARSAIIPRVTGDNLRKVMADHLDFPAVHLHTDAANTYRSMSSLFASHQSVDHSAGEYVRAGVSTNKAENFFSQLKRSLDGTHHHVSATHLHRYLAEFDFRYSTRKESDTARTRRLMRQVSGRRLTYKRVTT